MQMYQFVGVLMGIAIRTNNTLELDLPSLVWKPLVGQELEVSDLLAIDQICVGQMNLICDEKALLEKGIDESNFEDGQSQCTTRVYELIMQCTTQTLMMNK